jgi:hypothetical protein
MKRFIVLLLLLLASVVCCAAQQTAPSAPPSEQEVLDFFKVMHIREQTLEVLRGTEEQVKTIMRDLIHERIPNVTPGQLAQLDAMVGKLYENYPIDELLQDMVPVYRKHLTKANLDAVLAFYSTPTGQKLLRELPAMTAEAMQVSSARMQQDTEDLMRQLEDRITEIQKEQKQKGNAQPSHAPKPDSQP